jgi:N-acetylmuramic acid 6-phosphate etherase
MTLTITEARNPASEAIDLMTTLDMVRLMSAQDAQVAAAVAAEAEAIARAIDAIAWQMQSGGRLIYIGAGTSGRLGALDAAECPPTFNTPPALVTALIAGGEQALYRSVEDAEDDAEAGAQAITGIDVSANDSVIGLAASGGTPYVMGGMIEAKRRGALVISLACNRPSPMESLAQISIAPLPGPEVLAGSTRLKAGTAQKMVLNMISTGVMIRLGKTFGNLMVEVQPANTKLRARAVRSVAEACELSTAEAEAVLAMCNGEVKTAIVAMLTAVSPAEARRRLARANGFVRQALIL